LQIWLNSLNNHCDKIYLLGKNIDPKLLACRRATGPPVASNTMAIYRAFNAGAEGYLLHSFLF
ncbi:hypothetical protein, partial [Yersinia pestis]|uniref:hypothetical protein n=1 Tax=Yersinia pestis TaxID=632 RepID=UPI001EE42CBE